jgi:hypothetical protein
MLRVLVALICKNSVSASLFILVMQLVRRTGFASDIHNFLRNL